MRAKVKWASANVSENLDLGQQQLLSSTGRSSYAFWSAITVKADERLAVWTRDGELRVIEGPRKVSLWRSSYQYLSMHTATALEYLVVQFKDGTKDHLRGPTTIWFDPKKHAKISLGNLTKLNSNEAIVVYAQKEDGNVARRVVWGPTIYMPSISEWTHRFSWGGSDDDSSSNGQKKPQMQPMQQMQQMQAQQAYMPPATSKGQFSRLRTTPDTMEVDVELVRTADDGLLDVQLMITFQLVDVEKMLDTSEDPIRDLTNAVASDVVLVISKTRFNDFKGNTEVLNDVKTFKETLERAHKMGYEIQKVVFKGYQAGEALQNMLNDGIRSRTQLAVTEESERQHQRLLDFKLTQEQERAKERQKLELEQVKNKNIIREQELGQELKEKELRLAHEIAIAQAKAKEEISFMKSLLELGIQASDLGKYLASKFSPAPSKIIEMRGDASSPIPH